MKYIDSLDESEFMLSGNGKWTAGQQLDHIGRCVKPIALMLSLPGVIPTIIFGKANRPSRTFEELVNKYQEKLARGGQATGRYLPKQIPWSKKKELIQNLTRVIQKVTHKLANYNEKQLDKLIAPHPLIGKLTFREMMYFTVYHVEHHHKITIRNLESIS